MANFAIAATGTGGHVYPAYALAQGLELRGDKVVWFGKVDGLESGYAKEHVALAVSPVVGTKNKLMRVLGILKVIPKVCRNLRGIDKVIVFGGYVSVPVGIAALIMRKELIIQEQNAFPGRANRLLFPFASKVFVGFNGAFRGNKVIVTGNPLRFSREWQKPRNILVLGGSLGSAKIYDVILDCAKDVPECSFRVVSGLVNSVEQKSLQNVELLEYCEDMDRLYSWADVVISRAGALTISESIEYGLPMLLVPLGTAADNHQEFNARAAHVATTVLERDFSSLLVKRWLLGGPSSAVSRILSKI